MSKTTGFVEAHEESPWWEALGRGDCRRLMNLLEENPCRVVQKGPGGCTVLHAAAERGCLKLLDQVFDLFGDNRRFVDEKEKIKLTFEKLLEAQHIDIEDERVGLTAVEYAWWSMGECNAWQHLLDGRRHNSKTFVSFQSEIFRSSIDQAESVDEGSVSPRTLLLEVLVCNMNVISGRMRKEFEEDEKYNFVADCEELRFHHACGKLHSDEYRKYVEVVIGGCMQKGPHVLRYMSQLCNAQGQTSLHVAAHNDTCDILVPLIPGRESGENAECLNVRNAGGWTALHLVSSRRFGGRGLQALLEDGRADVNATQDVGNTGVTALHVAVMHDRPEAVKMFLADPRTDVNARFHKQIVFDENLRVTRSEHMWTALQWAAVAALPEVVKLLIACPQVKYVGNCPNEQKRSAEKRHGEENDDVWHDIAKISATHIAAASGDPTTLRLFITNLDYGALVTCHGSTCLHFVVPARQPNLFCVDHAHKNYGHEVLMCGKKMIMGTYLNLVDRRDYHLAWVQKVENEVLEAKKGMSSAGNAISIVGALVATASYVGPLQPPIGYANDLVQTSNLSIRIFMASNSTSFYLAIACMMFSVYPSLPIPHKGTYGNYIPPSNRLAIAMAIDLLVLSIIGIFISFGAASIAVMLEEYSWQHRGLTFYPIIAGGLGCVVAIKLYLVRLSEIFFPQGVWSWK